ncbi:ACT domain-containing protein [Candidatus Methanomassiliicoccus intestinalis]|uniref:ACT domain-containing protein n=1 Tax=Candidatus Methanomassiliicoccus intestinalis TaxID=1406512 RepID=UPI0037DD3C3E
MRFEEITKDTEIRASVRHKDYAISNVKEFPVQDQRIFAVITDGREISVIAEADLELDYISQEKPLRIISFDTKLPFDLIGFLAYITKLLADQDISIFALSAFSTDHLFMKEKYLERAVEVLKENGVIIEVE